MKKALLFSIMLFLCISQNVFAADHSSCAQVEVDKIFDSPGEALEDAMVRQRYDITHFVDYNEERNAHYADYTYHVKSDHKLTSAEILYPEGEKGVYYETGYVNIQGNRQKTLRLIDHTGNYLEGEFLNDVMQYIVANSTSNITYENGITTYKLHSDAGYRITKEEFEAFTNKMKEVIDSLELGGKSDLEKYIAITQWMWENINYNKQAKNPHNGYETFMNGEGVCDGFASVFAYMANYANLDCIILDTDYKGELHAINLIKIDQKYYLTDKTIDSMAFPENTGLYGLNTFPTKYSLTQETEFILKKYDVDMDSYGDPECKYGHAYSASYDDDCTCTGEGNITLTCKNCGRTKTKQQKYKYIWEFPTYDITKYRGLNWRLNHTGLTTEVLKEATCEEKGRVKVYCKDCGQYIEKKTEALGHDYQANVTQEKRYCTDIEITTYTCSRCGDYYTKVTKAKGTHKMDEGTVIKEPTLSQTGTMEYRCTECEYSYREDIPMLDSTDKEWYGDDPGENQISPAGWKWTKQSDGSYTAKLTRFMSNNTSTRESIEGTVSEERIESTCQKNGSVTYTAYAAFPGHPTLTSTKTVTWGKSSSTNHIWSEDIEYNWNEDSCTATRRCKYHNDVEETIPLDVTTLREELNEDTAQITYTAAGSFGPTVMEDLSVEEMEAKDIRIMTEEIEHSGRVYYSWDGKECTARKGEDTISLTVTESDHSCDEEGLLTAVGTFSDGTEAKDEKVVPAGEHQWGDFIEKTPASCEEEGEEIRTCQICKKEEKQTIPATGHLNTSLQNKKDATCKEAGYTGDIVCEDCKKVITKGEDIPATGHIHTEVRNAKDASCKENGYSGDTYCKDCGELLEEGKSTNKTEHQWGEFAVEKEASCNEDGMKVRICKTCQTRDEVILPATGHKNTEVRDRKEATCAEDGYSGDTYCKDCGELLQKGESIPKTSKHQWEESIQNATCTTAGKKIYTCKICHEKGEEIPIPATGHQHTEVRNAKTADCQKEGYSGDTYCKDCGNLIKAGAVIPKTTSHKWEETITKATCISAGKKTKICKICHEQGEVTTIPATGHQHTEVRNVKTADCKNDGYSGDTYCKDCGSLVKKGSSLPKLSHNWDNGTITKAATTTSTGIKTFTCTRCKETRTEMIPVLEVKEDPALAALPKAETVESTILRLKNKDAGGSSYNTLSLRLKKASKSSLSLVWKKVDADQYIIYGSLSGKPFKKLWTVTGTSYTHKKLKKGTYYKYLVVAVKNSGNTERVIETSKNVFATTTGGKVTNPKKLKLNKTKVVLKKGKAFTLKASILPAKVKKLRKVSFESSDTSVATVNAAGKIVGKKKGSCTIFVYAQNGLYKNVKVLIN